MMRRFLIFFVSVFILFSESTFALTEEQEQLIADYRAAGMADDEAAMTEAWDRILEDDQVVKHIAEKESQLVPHYYHRHSRRADNRVQQEAAAAGELAPFEEVHDRAANPPPRDTDRPVPVSGDPELADLADPTREHIPDGADPEIREVMDQAKVAEEARLEAERERLRIQNMDTAQRNAGGGKTGGESQDAGTRVNVDAGDGTALRVDGADSGTGGAQASDVEAQKLLPAPDEPKLLPASTGPDADAIPVGASGTTVMDSADSPLPRPDTPDGAPQIMENQTIRAPETPDAPKTKMTGLQKVGVGLEVTEKVGMVADSYLKEHEDAARDGREFRTDRAAAHTVYSALGGQAGEAAYKTGKIESQAYHRGEESLPVGYFGAATRALHEQAMSTYHQHRKIYQDAADEEVRRASREGEGASQLSATYQGATRSAGALVGADKLLDASMRDTDADRTAYDSQRKLQKMTKEFLENGLDELDKVAAQIKAMTEDPDYDPDAEVNIITLTKKYHEMYDELLAHDERIASKKLINTNDPEYIAIKNAYKGRTNPMEQIVSDQAVADAKRLTANCQFDEALKRLGEAKAGKARSSAEAGIASARANEEAVREMFYRAKEQAGEKNFSGAVVLLRQAAAQSACTETQIKINKILSGLMAELKEKEQQDAIYENVAALDCSRFENSRAYWSDEQARALCYCLPGYEWNNARTSCRIQSEILIEHSSCAQRIRGSKPVWDAGKEAVFCECPRGEVIINNTCEREVVYEDERYEEPYEDQTDWSGIATALTGMIKQANQTGYRAPRGSRGLSPAEAIERAAAKSPYQNVDVYGKEPSMFRKASSPGAGWVKSKTPAAPKPVKSSTVKKTASKSSGSGTGEFRDDSWSAPSATRTKKPQLIGGMVRGVGGEYEDGWHGVDGKVYDSYEEMYRGVKGTDPPNI